MNTPTVLRAAVELHDSRAATTDTEDDRMSLTTGKPAPRSGDGKPTSRAAEGVHLALAVEVPGVPKGTSLPQLDEKHWSRWSRYLARRKQPALLASLAQSEGLEPLRWGCASVQLDDETHDLLARLERRCLAVKTGESGLAEVAELWLKEAALREASAALGIESLAWCHALPLLADEFGPSLWRRLLEQLINVGQDGAAVSAETSPLVQQLLAGELPLTLAWLFPEIAACVPLAKSARTVLSDGVINLLDEGLPSGEQLAIARALLACWTRAALIGESLKSGRFRSGAQDQFRNFVRHAVCFSRPDGGQMLSTDGDAAQGALLAAALRVVSDDSATVTAEALFSGQGPPLNGKRRLFLPSGVHSEWSELAVLRASWSKSSPALAINYSGGELASELISQQRVIWSGSCQPQVRIDGAAAAKIERWEEVCWFSDDDVHYIELEAGLAENDWKIQRQFLLVRTDAILLIADAIIGPASADVEYQCVWPTTSAIDFTAAQETCEGLLHTGARRWANVAPLALPEWRSDGRRQGALLAADNGLTYRIARRAQRMYVPLVIDLEPWRMKRELTWRQLTVGLNLAPQSPEVAVAYRVQLYKQQWLIYRSLAERASRTVLGQNIYNEFVCARFNRGGDAETLIEIE